MAWIAALVLGVVLGALATRAVPVLQEARRGATGGTAEAPASASGPVVKLPAPRLDGSVSLEHAMAERHSVRSFESTPLTEAQLSQLLWAAQGITRADTGGRTVPSASRTYPVEILAADALGVWRYVPSTHSLTRIGAGDSRADIASVSAGQSWMAEAPVVFLITVVESRSAVQHGRRAERFVTLEAGHACQNLLLEATALGLGGTSVGSFDDPVLARVAHLPSGWKPLYVVPVGVPR